MGRPVRIGLPLVLRVHGQTAAGGRQVAVKVGQRRLAIAQRAGVFIALAGLQLQAGDQAVLVGDELRILAVAADAGFFLR